VYEELSCDHPHVMHYAISSTCVFGFILQDLNHEFAARFADELILHDKNAKVLGSPNIATQSKLSAIIGEGNGHFFKYSLLGHIYLLIIVLIEEVCKELLLHNQQL
jgi:hypothetical protein